MDKATEAIVALGNALRDSQYHFITPTPETHRRVRARAVAAGADIATSLRDVFGFSRLFPENLLGDSMLQLLADAGALEQHGELFKSGLRFSTLGADIFAHSAYPTTQADAVFFGPDTYRFASLLERVAPRCQRVVDIGAGSGAGALSIRGRAQRVTLADISPRALGIAHANSALARCRSEIVESDVLAGVDGPIDLIISNPPYIRDEASRVYRDGGGNFGEALSLRIVEEALERLSPGGTLVLYTGATIVDGADTFYRGVEPLTVGRAARVEYRELDPDVFGEELSEPAYRDAERIAAVGLVVER